MILKDDMTIHDMQLELFDCIGAHMLPFTLVSTILGQVEIQGVVFDHLMAPPKIIISILRRKDGISSFERYWT